MLLGDEPMRLADLDADALAALKTIRWDRIIEKHEGPENWESVLKWYDPEFMEIDGRSVLLPIERSSHTHITILRTIWSSDDRSLTVFLKDTTYDDCWATSGYVAVCDRMVGYDFYVAILYHEWFVIDPSSALQTCKDPI